jgi:hypothetical protein
MDFYFAVDDTLHACWPQLALLFLQSRWSHDAYLWWSAVRQVAVALVEKTGYDLTLWSVLIRYINACYLNSCVIRWLCKILCMCAGLYKFSVYIGWNTFLEFLCIFVEIHSWKGTGRIKNGPKVIGPIMKPWSGLKKPKLKLYNILNSRKLVWSKRNMGLKEASAQTIILELVQKLRKKSRWKTVNVL